MPRARAAGGGGGRARDPGPRGSDRGDGRDGRRQSRHQCRVVVAIALHVHQTARCDFTVELAVGIEDGLDDD